MGEPEIVLNLWYVIDKGTGYAYCLLGRAYAMTGTDEEKLALLRELASTDYLANLGVVLARLGKNDSMKHFVRKLPSDEN
jgi:hypothetical protein